MLLTTQQGDLDTSPGQALVSQQEFSSDQVLGCFGDSSETGVSYFACAPLPQSLETIQELPKDHCAYDDVFFAYEEPPSFRVPECSLSTSPEPPFYNCQTPICNQLQPVPSYQALDTTTKLVSSSSQAATTQQSKPPKQCPTQHARQQTSMDAKEEVLRSPHILLDETTLTGRAHPAEETVMEHKMYPEGWVRWGPDARFESLESLTTRFNEDSIGIRQLTSFGLGVIPQDAEESGHGSGTASPPPSASNVSKSQTCTKRLLRPCEGTRHAVRTSSEPIKSCTRLATTGRSTEQPQAGIEVKGQRQKITTEQKRLNHIRHEIKRRSRIRDGFNDLTELIPELRDRRLSRSKILFKATRFMESLVQENESLFAQVSALESKNLACGSIKDEVWGRVGEVVSLSTPTGNNHCRY